MDNFPWNIERISLEIQLYLHEHPNSADTLEGITKWWLARQRFEEDRKLVKQALEHLIARGFVVRSTNADAQCIYRKANIRSDWTRQ